MQCSDVALAEGEERADRLTTKGSSSNVVFDPETKMTRERVGDTAFRTLPQEQPWRRWGTTIVLALAVGLLSASESLAQANIRWVVSFNGAPIGPLTTVWDNDLNGDDINPNVSDVSTLITVTNGPMTLTGQLNGYYFRTVPDDLPGRRFDFTTGPPAPPPPPPGVVPSTASVAPGQFQNPAGTIELFACYSFELTPVGPPHTFGSLIAGFYDNIAGNDIDLAKVEYQSDDDLCSFARPVPVAQSMPAAIQIAPVVPFSDFLGGGPFPSATYRIGTYHRFVVHNDGDAVLLPGSTEASAVAVAAVPVLSEVGFVSLLVGVLSIGVFAIRRARSHEV